MLQLLIKKIVTALCKPIVSLYLKKTRSYSYKGIKVKVLPGVFHPGFFGSTKMLLSYLQTQNLQDKKVLEPGAGSGIISLLCLKKGAFVLATDINPVAIAGLKSNLFVTSANEQSRAICLESDLFDSIPQQVFDYIVINPPFYQKTVEKVEQHAWNAGKNLEYFNRLFATLKMYSNKETNVLMVFPQIKELPKVIAIAHHWGYELKELKSENLFYETMTLFKAETIA